MRVSFHIVVAALVVSLSACGDSSGPKATPASIELSNEPTGTPAAGLPLSTAPTFVVKDKDGNPLGGVSVTISVTEGGGSIANAPTKSKTPSTSVGTWTLGKTIGLNTLTITVSGLTPIVINVTTGPGAPAKIVATGSSTINGTVGQTVAPLTATVRDAFDNAIPGATVNVAVVGGGSIAATSVTSDGSGSISVPAWTLGTVKGNQTLTLSLGSATLTFTAAAAAGPIETFNVLSGQDQSGLAGTTLPVAPRFEPLDQFGNRLDNQTANFSVLSGGGSLTAFTGTAGADGIITMPAWTLGKLALPQQVIASIGARSVILRAAVTTNYSIDIRLWGTPMTAAQQVLFTNAAARIRAAVIGAIPTTDATGADPSVCGVTGVPILAENVPGVIIYASVQSIDGPGRILAQAGPCYVRDDPDLRTVIGVMEFDSDDLASLSGDGNLQDIITHEMLHVIGLGTFWTDKNLLTGATTADVAYTGAGGIAGCIATGGTTTCATSVPVENTGGSGTADSHWRETTFGNELMTGFANSGHLPMSIMTVRSLADIGYTVNPAAAETYHIFAGNLQAGGNRAAPAGMVWERGLGVAPRMLPRGGRGSSKK